MKSLYAVTLPNAKGQLVAYNIIALSMAAATSGAQKQAGVSEAVEPHTIQKLAAIDFEV